MKIMVELLTQLLLMIVVMESEMFLGVGVGGGSIEDSDDEKFGISFTFRRFSSSDFYKQEELWYSAC